MLKKLTILFVLMLASQAQAADLNFTTGTFRLGVPEKTYQPYETPLNNNFESMDVIMSIMSEDIDVASEMWVNVERFGTAYPANVHDAIDFAKANSLKNIYFPSGGTVTFSDTMVLDEIMVYYFAKRNFTYTGTSDAIQVTAGGASIQGHLQLVNDVAQGDGAVGINMTACKTTRHEWHQITGFDVGLKIASTTSTGISYSSFKGAITSTLVGIQIECTSPGWVTDLAFYDMRIGGVAGPAATSKGINCVFTSGTMGYFLFTACTFEAFHTKAYLDGTKFTFMRPYMEGTGTYNIHIGPTVQYLEVYSPTVITLTTLIGKNDAGDGVDIAIVDSRFAKNNLFFDKGLFEGEDQGFNNILPNANCESWDDVVTDAAPIGGYTIPTSGGGWATGYPARSSTFRFGAYSAAVKGKVGTTRSYIRYDVPNYTDYLSEDVTFGIWAWSDIPAGILAVVGDSVHTKFGTGHSGGGDWEYITATISMDSAATYLRAEVAVYAVQTTEGYVDGFMLTTGTNQTPRFSPKYITDTDNQRIYSRLDVRTLSVDGVLTASGDSAFYARLDTAGLSTDSATITNSLIVNTNKLVVDSAGNVGIGVVNPTQALAVAGGVSVDTSLAVSGDTTLYGRVSCDGISVDGSIRATLDIVTPVLSIDTTLRIGFTSATVATGGELGTIAIISSDGTTVYLKTYAVS